LAVGGVLLAIFATLGLPFATGPTGAEGGGSCWIILGGSGLLLLGIGAHSGAFAQRRAASSAFWLAAGIALAALDAVTWICPNSGTLHVATMHLSPAAVLIAVAGLVGVWLHRRSQTRP
jgi:hypothetical protein